jgi:Helicase conserved C-terminal domain
MSYGSWGRPREYDNRAFHEKGFRRRDLAEWDARWHQLSPAARLAFLDQVKGPVRSYTNAPQPSVGADRFDAEALKELVDAGFVVVGPGKKSGPDRVSAVAGCYDFAARARVLRRHGPLIGGTVAALPKRIEAMCYPGPFMQAIADILRKVGINDYLSVDAAIERYVVGHRWPGWVAEISKGPLAGRVIEEVRKAAGPVPIVELAARVKGDAGDVREAIDRLVGYFALIEDFDPATLAIVVDLPAGAREAMDQAGRPRVRPPLEKVDAPKDVGPEGGFSVHDLRALLLEIASEPPRLRQDKAFFQKEVDRFLAALDPMPKWLTESLDWSIGDRIEDAHTWARLMTLVTESADGKATRLGLSDKGERWLASPLEDQYASLFDQLRGKPRAGALDHLRYLDDDRYNGYGYDAVGFTDVRFLGDNVVAVKKKGTSGYYVDPKPEDIQALRESFYRGLSALEVGAYYRVDRLVESICFGDSNPLLVGQAQEEVIVARNGRRVPPLAEQREEVGRIALRVFIGERLIPLGCLRVAVDAEGKLCAARMPRLDAYFGRKVAAADLAGLPGGESKVIVQPDFSVVIIGTSPAPAAALAPICERSTKGSGHGAMVLKLTRESVVKAVANGLKPEEVVARLKQHASNDVPANVLREVEGWSGWVRRVSFGSMAVLRCPDAETADRVMGALKRGTERINETIVAVDGAKLAPADRAKLKEQGVIVQVSAEPAARPAAPKKRRRSW